MKENVYERIWKLQRMVLRNFIGLYYENIWFVICNDLNRLEINLMILADNGHDIKTIIGNSRLLTISTTSNGTPTDGITSAFEMY